MRLLLPIDLIQECTRVVLSTEYSTRVLCSRYIYCKYCNSRHTAHMHPTRYQGLEYTVYMCTHSSPSRYSYIAIATAIATHYHYGLHTSMLPWTPQHHGVTHWQKSWTSWSCRSSKVWHNGTARVACMLHVSIAGYVAMGCIGWHYWYQYLE